MLESRKYPMTSWLYEGLRFPPPQSDWHVAKAKCSFTLPQDHVCFRSIEHLCSIRFKPLSYLLSLSFGHENINILCYSVNLLFLSLNFLTSLSLPYPLIFFRFLLLINRLKVTLSSADKSRKLQILKRRAECRYS